MNIPKKFKQGNKIYKLIKIYPNYGLYENQYNIRECFSSYDFNLIESKKENITYINPEKVKI